MNKKKALYTVLGVVTATLLLWSVWAESQVRVIIPGTRVYSGQQLFPNGTIALPSQAFVNDLTTGFRLDADGVMGFSAAGNSLYLFDGVLGRFTLGATQSIAWSNSSSPIASSPVDVTLFRDAPGILALRNGTNAQEQRWYNSDSGANDEFLSLGWRNVANEFRIESEATGTGTVRNIRLEPGTADLVWGKALVALGGGAAPTLGTIGGSGPATAAQNAWMRVVDSTGAAFWVMAWK